MSAQWPKNSHNRMIIGIGTPISQSNSPRAIDVLRWLFDQREVLRVVPHHDADAGDLCWTGPQAPYQWPVFGIEAHGSCGGSASPFCSNSTDCRSGDRTNAIWPSRGGRLMVMPSSISFAQVA